MKKSSFILFNIFLALLFPVLASAQVFENPLGYETIQEFLSAVLKAVVLIVSPIIVLFVVYSGFLFVSAQGNEEKLNTAKKVFLWTVIGAVLVLGAQALAIAIEGTVREIQRGT